MRPWAETAILGHSAMQERRFRGTSDNFSEHFGVRAYSGENEDLDAKLGQPARSIECHVGAALGQAPTQHEPPQENAADQQRQQHEGDHADEVEHVFVTL